MARHSKHLSLNSPLLAQNLARLQDASLHPYYREQAAEVVYTCTQPYAVQQADAYRVRGEQLGIEHADLVQTNGLRLWEYVASPERQQQPQTPEKFLKNVYLLMRDTMMSTCAAGSGSVVVRDEAPDQVAGSIAPFSWRLCHDLTEVDPAVRAADRASYRAAALQPACSLESVAPGGVTAAFASRALLPDGDEIFDGVFDPPLIGAATCIADPVPGPDAQVDFNRQRGQVAAFARRYVSEGQYEILSLRFGLEDTHNRALSLQEVADQQGVSRARVAWLEAEALKKLQAHGKRDTAPARALRLMCLRSE